MQVAVARLCRAGGRGAAVAVRDQLHRLVCAAPSFVEDPSQGLKEVP